MCTWSAFAGVFVGSVCTFSTIFTRCAGALVHIHLTQIPREPCRDKCMPRLFWLLNHNASSLLVFMIRSLKNNNAAVTFGTFAVERVDLVDAFSIVEARLWCTVIRVYLTKQTLVACTPKQSIRTTVMMCFWCRSCRSMVKDSYLACRCSGIHQSGRGRWRRSGRGSTCTHWHPSHSVDLHNLEDTCTGTSL